MIFNAIVIAILAIICIWAYCEDTLPETLFVLIVAGGIVSCHESNWYQESKRAEAASKAVQDKADATPRVIREADGCKVYTFKEDGSWHFFTRCKATITTERHFTVPCGKKTCHRTETIPAENV